MDEGAQKQQQELLERLKQPGDNRPLPEQVVNRLKEFLQALGNQPAQPTADFNELIKFVRQNCTEEHKGETYIAVLEWADDVRSQPELPPLVPASPPPPKQEFEEDKPWPENAQLELEELRQLVEQLTAELKKAQLEAQKLREQNQQFQEQLTKLEGILRELSSQADKAQEDGWLTKRTKDLLEALEAIREHLFKPDRLIQLPPAALALQYGGPAEATTTMAASILLTEIVKKIPEVAAQGPCTHEARRRSNTQNSRRR